MTLAELYNKTLDEKNTVEILNIDGDGTGLVITLKRHDADSVVLAALRYNRLVRVIVDKFERDHSELKAESELAGDFGEYNMLFSMALRDVRHAFAAELVDSWTSDEELTAAGLVDQLNLCSGDNPPAKQIIDAYDTALAKRSKK